MYACAPTNSAILLDAGSAPPRRPLRSTSVCQPKNSSVVHRIAGARVAHRQQATRTAATTTALRDATQRWASGGGKLARVSTVPSEPAPGEREQEKSSSAIHAVRRHGRDGVDELRGREPKSDLRSGDRLWRSMVKLLLTRMVTFRMLNQDITDLFERVAVGTNVVVLR